MVMTDEFFCGDKGWMVCEHVGSCKCLERRCAAASFIPACVIVCGVTMVLFEKKRGTNTPCHVQPSVGASTVYRRCRVL
jgi:hypothetical protein